MRTVLVAAGASLLLTLLVTPLFIRILVRQGLNRLAWLDRPTGAPRFDGPQVVEWWCRAALLCRATYSSSVVRFFANQ